MLTLEDTRLRELLHGDMRAAWALTEIHDDPPMLPASAADLPRGFLILGDLEPRRGEYGASPAEVHVPHVYRIVGQFAWPTSGTWEAAKLEKQKALVNILTLQKRYGGWMRDILAIRFRNAEMEASKEAVYEVEVEFKIDVITSA